MNWASLLFGGAVGVIVGLAIFQWFQQQQYLRALAVFGVGGGAGGVIKALLDISGVAKLEIPTLLAAYGACAVLTMLARWFLADRTVGRVPPEVHMTQAKWASLTPRQRLILHLRLVKGLSQSEVAQKLGLSEADVNKEFLRALKAGE